MKHGGFDVIIGNPPFVEYAKIRRHYTIKNYSTEKAGNLYAYVVERAFKLTRNGGRSGFIVPMSSMSSRRTQELRELLLNSAGTIHVSSYAGDAHPSILFEGVRLRLSIILCSHARKDTSVLYTTLFQRWYAAERSELFSRITYWPASVIPLWSIFLRLGGDNAPEVWKRLLNSRNNELLTTHLGNGSPVFYQEAAQYFVKASQRLPYFTKNGEPGAPPHGRFIHCSESQAPSVVAVLSSTLFYVWYHGVSDCYHVSDTIVQAFPCPKAALEHPALQQLGQLLETELHNRAKTTKITTTSGDTIEYAAFNCQATKHITNEIDRELGKFYGFTAAELDFIVNYDGKYRMGRDAAEE